MTADLEDLKSRLVVGRKRDGRCIYDEAAKAELVELCLQSGISVARLARECGVNANQVSRWLRHQLDRVAERLQLAGPMVSTATRFHVDQARRQVREERGHLVPADLFAQRDLAVLGDAVDLEHILGQVDTNRRNLHGGRPFRFEWLMTLPLWHIDAVVGWGRPSHCLRYKRADQAFASIHAQL